LSAFAIAPLLLGQHFGWAFFVLVAASASDFMDGYLARKFKVETKIGGVLDHIGDKLLVANSLVMMVMFLQIWMVIIPAVIMICRELYVSGLREFMGAHKIEMGVPKYRFSFGKIKAAAQMIGLSMMFLWIWAVNADWAWIETPVIFSDELVLSYSGILLHCSIGALWLAMLFSLISAAQYTVAFAGNLKKIK
jgi:CDP-diacylglycerol--glycerol-3-phosphate 3-phosphatidyltransferase